MTDKQDRVITTVIAVLFVSAMLLIGAAGYFSQVY